jgi:hypothetical protein
MSMNPGASTRPSRFTTSVSAAGVSVPASATTEIRPSVTATSDGRAGAPDPSTNNPPRSNRSMDVSDRRLSCALQLT